MRQTSLPHRTRAGLPHRRQPRACFCRLPTAFRIAHMPTSKIYNAFTWLDRQLISTKMRMVVWIFLALSIVIASTGLVAFNRLKSVGQIEALLSASAVVVSDARSMITEASLQIE